MEHAHQAGETAAAQPADTVADSRQYFNEFLPRLIEEKKDIKVGNTNFTCMFRIRGEKGGCWRLTIEKGRFQPIVPCEDGQAPCTIEMDDAILMQIITGKLQPTHAFFRGQVKLRGQIQTLIKLSTLLPIYFRKHTLKTK